MAKKGAAHHSAKLTAEQAREIWRSPRNITNRELGLQYKVSAVACWKIRKRITWKHVV